MTNMELAKFHVVDEPINGKFYTYYNNDQIRSVVNYVNNDRIGQHYFYDINGKIECVIHYDKGKPVKFEDYKKNNY